MKPASWSCQFAQERRWQPNESVVGAIKGETRGRVHQTAPNYAHFSIYIYIYSLSAMLRRAKSNWSVLAAKAAHIYSVTRRRASWIEIAR